MDNFLQTFMFIITAENHYEHKKITNLFSTLFDNIILTLVINCLNDRKSTLITY